MALPLRLAAGLEAVRPEECDTVSIAGMGGQTIADILAAAPWTGDGEHLLLLQPMTMVYELRQWLWAHGYMIECETVCREERRYYVVLSVRGGGPVRVVPLSSCAFSPALLQAAGARDYLEKLLQREIRALEGMQSGSAVDRAVLDGQREIVRVIKQAWEELA